MSLNGHPPDNVDSPGVHVQLLAHEGPNAPAALNRQHDVNHPLSRAVAQDPETIHATSAHPSAKADCASTLKDFSTQGVS